MRYTFSNITLSILTASLLIFLSAESYACSTFKLQSDEGLVYGHNLNEGDIGVPGMIFINKRGVFKKGRTWSELTTRNRENPSQHHWISRYGSVTFNVFGRDLPDGGMNEMGLYIWEMNEDAEYPRGEGKPKLTQMNWMQYVLDNFATTEEAIRCASRVEIDGWGWHYFVGDARGNTAAIAFLEGKPVVHTGTRMPVPGLFNTPYDRELELLKYYEGFGGQYEVDPADPNVPRFVKCAVLVRDYDSGRNIVEYGLNMLAQLQVNDVPEWSILFDVRNRDLHFRTRLNPGVKVLDLDALDFSNQTPCQILNMDVEKAGNVLSLFHAYSTEAMGEFFIESLLPILPEKFFTSGGITLDEYMDRMSTITQYAAQPSSQYFTGTWKNDPASGSDERSITLELTSLNDAVSGQISLTNDLTKGYRLDHIHMIGPRLTFTCKTMDKTFIEVQAIIEGDTMTAGIFTIEDSQGSYTLHKSK